MDSLAGFPDVTIQVDSTAPLVSVERFLEIRKYTEHLLSPLSEADAQLQSMPDVSPAKWHAAHTTWFFETFILCHYLPNYSRVSEAFNYLFNSYYNGVGEQYPRHQRGLISRPSLVDVIQYRHTIDAAICELIANSNREDVAYLELNKLIELGLQHEQQHQELLLTDIKHNLFQNPLYPAYHQPRIKEKVFSAPPLTWLPIKEGMASIGCDGSHFSYDNERPVHSVYLHEYSLASRLVTNGEYKTFIESGGYDNSDYWLADGWSWLQSQKLNGEKGLLSPLYWLKQDNQWFEYTLYGLLPLDEHQPVIHVNYYEAYAYANWLGVRLPTEFEWENAVQQYHVQPDISASDYHPDVGLGCNSGQLNQLFAQGWQWTTSSYAPYPGFIPFSGTAGEYNGKFMSNQYVLRGASCVTPVGHARLSYRNFFYAHQRWQFTSIRLAK